MDKIKNVRSPVLSLNKKLEQEIANKKKIAQNITKELYTALLFYW